MNEFVFGQFQLNDFDSFLVSTNEFSLPLIEVEPFGFHDVVRILSRIGVGSNERKILTQSCHILRTLDHLKDERFFLLHFKELLALEGKKVHFKGEDFLRLKWIAGYLQNKKKIEILNPFLKLECLSLYRSSIKLSIVFARDDEWTVKRKFNFSHKRYH